MKILVIRESNPYIFSNATNNRFLSLAEGLSTKNVKISFCFLSGYSNKFEKVKYKSKGEYNDFNYTYLLPVLMTNLFVRQFFYRLFPTTFLFRKFEKEINFNCYDIIWLGYDPKAIQFGTMMMKKYKHLKYFHERSEFSWIGLSQFKRLHAIYLNNFLPNLDSLALMTQTLLRYYKKFTKKNCEIFHLAMTVDFSRFEIPSEIRKNNYIGYCGTMNNKKDGVDILIKSFVSISSEFPEINLYIAGPLKPNKDYMILKDIIKKNKIDERVCFLGEISRNEIPNFLINAKVLAMARPDSKQAKGGFPTKLGEYLATGNPVCVTNVGEISNYLSDNNSAYIAKPSSIKSFKSSLSRALSDVNANKVGRLGREIARKKFNKDIQVDYLYNKLTQLK